MRRLVLSGSRHALVGNSGLHVAEGERVAVVGENGAGKSTLIKALLGLVPTSRTDVTVLGKAVRNRASQREARHRIAWISQNSAVSDFPVTSRELFGTVGAGPDAAQIATAFGLGSELDTPVQLLSGGQRQRMHVSRAFGQLRARRGILLADEPSTGLDDRSVGILRDLLDDTRVAGLIVTHDERLLSSAHRVITMREGRLVA